MISKLELEVRYNETDQMGVVYHANYLVWLEMGRVKVLADLGFNYARLEDRGILFPVRNVNITYLKPCRYGENIVIETSVKEFSNVKTIYQHQIKNSHNELKAEAESTVVCVKKDTFQLMKLSTQAKDVFDALNQITVNS